MTKFDMLMEEFGAICANRPSELAEAHAKGVKVVEYTGNFVPEELIYAAGAKPYPLWRGGEPDPTEAVLEESVRFLNPLARSIAGFYYLGVDPVTPFADMIAFTQSDCHIYRMAELLESRGLNVVKVGVPTDWKQEEDFSYYLQKVTALKDALEKLTGNTVTDEALRTYIGFTNRINELLRQIDKLRKLPNPPITGLDFIKLNHYTTMCEPETAIEMLEKILQALQEEDPHNESRVRLQIAGRAVAVGDYVVVRALEEAGAIVVNEFLDEAYRWFASDTVTEGDPLRNLCAARYLEKPPINNFQPAWVQRHDCMLEQCEDYAVDGVIWYELLYDEIHDMEFSIMTERFDKEDMPLMRIQTSYEYTREAMGPLNTRIETFITALKGAK